MTLVEFRPLSGIFSVIEDVEAAEAAEAAESAEAAEAAEVKQDEDAKTTYEEPLAIPSPTPLNSTLSEEVEGFEPPAPIVVTNVEVELFEPETEVTVKLFRAIKRARTANKWYLRCTY